MVLSYLRQIYTANHATFPIRKCKNTVQICGNFWVTQYIASHKIRYGELYASVLRGYCLTSTSFVGQHYWFKVSIRIFAYSDTTDFRKLAESLDESEHKTQRTFIYETHCTVCPRSSDPFCIVTYDMKWVTTSWTDRTLRMVGYLD